MWLAVPAFPDRIAACWWIYDLLFEDTGVPRPSAWR